MWPFCVNIYFLKPYRHPSLQKIYHDLTCHWKPATAAEKKQPTTKDAPWSSSETVNFQICSSTLSSNSTSLTLTLTWATTIICSCPCTAQPTSSPRMTRPTQITTLSTITGNSLNKPLRSVWDRADITSLQATEMDYPEILRPTSGDIINKTLAKNLLSDLLRVTDNTNHRHPLDLRVNPTLHNPALTTSL